MVASRSTLVFDGILHKFTDSNSIPFLSFRLWVGLWTVLMLLLLVATNASGVLLILTRFTLELFSVLLSIVFIVFIFIKFWNVHHCCYARSYVFYTNSDWECNCYHETTNFSNNSAREINCTIDGYEVRMSGDDCAEDYIPDVFFLSIILLFGTFLIAMYLKKFYSTPFLTSLVSQRIVF